MIRTVEDYTAYITSIDDFREHEERVIKTHWTSFAHISATNRDTMHTKRMCGVCVYNPLSYGYCIRVRKCGEDDKAGYSSLAVWINTEPEPEPPAPEPETSFNPNQYPFF